MANITAKTSSNTFYKARCEAATHKSGFYILDAYQCTIKAKRLEKKYKKIFDVIDADMEKFGELPDDYQNFVEEKVFNTENYIFYNTKEKRAYCTSCKT